MDKKSTFLQLKEKERAYRRDLILDAAMRLFTNRPFHEIGMRDIAEEAGISPASIYRYFTSRDDILAEILGQEVQEGKKRQQERIQSGSADLEDIASGIVDFFLEKESAFQMLGHFLLSDEVDEEAKEKFNAIRDYYLGEFDTVLEKTGQAGGNARLFSNAYVASLLGVIMSFRKNGEMPEQERRSQLHRLAGLTANVFKNGLS
jgi:AcrR family transcriptional regulator